MSTWLNRLSMRADEVGNMGRRSAEGGAPEHYIL